MVYCSFGTCVYNEAENIEAFLLSIFRQKQSSAKITEIIIVSSGSTDNTKKIVLSFAKKDKRICFLEQKKREGKASAVNLFIKNAKNDILVLASADLVLKNDAVEKLLAPFKKENTGMTGIQPVPMNNINDGISGFAAHMLWEMHHNISLRHPKMGEVIAFRKVFKRIPQTSGADEASVEPLIRGQGYDIVYAPAAIAYNKAPESIREFINQRRRYYVQHQIVKFEQYYVVSTLNIIWIFQALFAFLWDNRKPKFFFLTPLVILFEIYSRALGFWEYHFGKKRYAVWEPATSTKNPNVSVS